MNKIFVVVASSFPVALGILKIYLHIISPWRFGFLDYLVSIGLILGGLFLLVQPRLSVVLLVSSLLLSFELYKAIVDYSDHFDLFLSMTATVYLSLPFLQIYFKNFRLKDS
jgi:hypothetical protein